MSDDKVKEKMESRDGVPICCGKKTKQDFKSTEEMGFDVYDCSKCGKVIYW